MNTLHEWVAGLKPNFSTEPFHIESELTPDSRVTVFRVFGIAILKISYKTSIVKVVKPKADK